MLLRIVEEFSDELKILGSGALNMLSRDKDVQGLFKQFGACEKLIGQLVTTQNDQVRQNILGCFQTLTAVAGAADDFDLLVEMRNLHLIHILLDMLMVDAHRCNPNMMGSIITILTNMSLND